MFPSSTDVIILLLTVRKTNRERTIKGKIIEGSIERLSTTFLSRKEKIGNQFYLNVAGWCQTERVVLSHQLNESLFS